MDGYHLSNKELDALGRRNRKGAPDTFDSFGFCAELAQNISSGPTYTYTVVPINEVDAATRRADKVIGMHFMNPVPVMKLTEVVKTLVTDEATVAETSQFAQSLGKTVILAKDNPGFIVNRLLIPYLLDAVRVLEQRVGTIADIDLALKQNDENPVFYVQYGHARGHSIFRNAAEAISDLPKDAADRPAFLAAAKLDRLGDAGELSLMRKIAVYPRLIEAAALG